MISAIIYNSLTGSCEKYAKLLSAALHVPAKPLGEAVRTDGKVIYIGWARAGSIYGYAKAAKKYDIAAAVLVSMSPASEKNLAAARKADNIGEDVKLFNVQGGFSMEKLPLPYRLIMKLINKKIVKRISALPAMVWISSLSRPSKVFVFKSPPRITGILGNTFSTASKMTCICARRPSPCVRFSK